MGKNMHDEIRKFEVFIPDWKEKLAVSASWNAQWNHPKIKLCSSYI